MIIQARSAVIDGAIRENIWLEIAAGRIASINGGTVENPNQITTGTLIPGFVDMHCHGGGGKYFSAQTPGEIEQAISTHRIHGTTTSLASLVSEPIEDLKAQIQRLRPFVDNGDLAGIHLEGPYLSSARCGAHDPKLLRSPKISELQELLDIAGGSIRMLTLAPELDGAMAAIKFLTANGVVVAIGHSNADYETGVRAIDAGATVITHLHNAMPKFADGEKTLLHAALGDARLTLELILDGHHVNQQIVTRIFNEAKGPIALITDAMSGAGQGDGSYSIGALPVTIKGGVARLDSDNSLAGSTLTMDTAFFSAQLEHGKTLVEAVKLTSTNPAKALGLNGRGAIAVGNLAHLLEVNVEGRTISQIGNF